MLKEGTNNVVGGSTWSRVCDTCRSAPCILYCHADSAYLCLSCDERVHAANRVASRHKRVLVCEACERAPAAFLCKADAASLCSSCDADIHSANPLASRHHRVPILPISGPLLEEFEEEKVVVVVDDGHYDNDEDEIEAASWLLPNPLKDDDDKEDQNDDDNGFLFGYKYLDHNLVDCNCCDHNNQFSSNVYQQQQIYNHNNNTVPQNIYALVPVQVPQQLQHFKPGLDFDSSKAGFSYEGSLSQSVSVSSMDVGVVPESTISDISMSHSKSSIGTNDLFPPLPMSSHYLTPMDREAKVLRYKEKKKTRKFEKKIRYASRKAYAETRPRIKGRFAKRTDVEAEVDQMFSSTLFSTEVGDSFFASF